MLVVDPMLPPAVAPAPPSSSWKNYGCKHIKMMNIIAAPKAWCGLSRIIPDVEFYVAALDERLNDHGYIVPGLGDAGDRILAQSKGSQQRVALRCAPLRHFPFSAFFWR